MNVYNILLLGSLKWRDIFGDLGRDGMDIKKRIEDMNWVHVA